MPQYVGNFTHRGFCHFGREYWAQKRNIQFFLDFWKHHGKKPHENYRKKFSLINQFLYVFQCSFYVYVCFVYLLLCLQSIFFANISLVFTITARSWYLVQHQRMDRDFTRKKIFLEIIFSVKSIAMTKKRLDFSALFVLPRAF